MEVEKFSRKYNVRLLKYEDADEVFELCKKNELYYEHCPPMATKESILEDIRLCHQENSWRTSFI